MPAATENNNQASLNIDLMSTYDVLKTINDEDQKIAFAIREQLPQIAEAVDLICDCLRRGGRMAYFGAVTSGRIAILDAADCAPTFGIAPETIQAFIAGGHPSLLEALDGVEDSAELAAQDISTFNPGGDDIIVSVSASGNPQYVVSVLEEARKRGAHTIGISSNPEARLRTFADIFICPQLGAEVISGSSRMKSGTAQKMILNMLSTGAMVRLGKTYQNLMVDVTISNQKLYRRACSIISRITGIDENEAQKYLEQSGKNVKTACVMAHCHCSKGEAENVLAQNNGILRKIISL